MTSKFWKDLYESLGSKLNFSLAYHPKTNGQSEITNFTIIDLIKACVVEVGQSEQWEKYLPLVENTYNNTIHTSIGKAPIELIEGRPKTPLIVKPHEKIFVINEYSKDLKKYF